MPRASPQKTDEGATHGTCVLCHWLLRCGKVEATACLASRKSDPGHFARCGVSVPAMSSLNEGYQSFSFWSRARWGRRAEGMLIAVFGAIWGLGLAAQKCARRPLGGSWDLITTYNWAYNPTYNWDNPNKALSGYYKWG